MADVSGQIERASQWLATYGMRIEKVAGTAPLLIVACLLIFTINVLLRHLSPGSGRFSLPYEAYVMVRRTVNSMLAIAAGLILLSFWGVSVGGVWTFLASAAAVIGVGFLAFWTMVSNVTAGVFITIWRPFHLGETIEIIPETVKGRVVDRNMMFTVIREPGGTALYVPNNLFFQKMFRVSDSHEQYLLESLLASENATSLQHAPSTAGSRDGVGS
jgi:small-conductance mechanosensitive channel